MLKDIDADLNAKLAIVREIEGQKKDHCSELYSRPSHRRRMEIVISILKKLVKGSNFIDIGCAEGLYSNIAYEYGAKRVLGIDISPTKISRARERYPKCEFNCREIYELNDLESHFDVALCSEVLQHVLNYQLAAQAIFSCLKPGGYAIFTVPNLSDSQNHIFAAISSDMTSEQLLLEIGGAGFGRQNALWKFNTEKLFKELVENNNVTLVEKKSVDTPDGQRKNLWTVGVFQIDT